MMQSIQEMYVPSQISKFIYKKNNNFFILQKKNKKIKDKLKILFKWPMCYSRKSNAIQPQHNAFSNIIHL